MAVRRESVVLTLDDQFSTGMARAAAATALLNRELTSASHRLGTAERGTGKLASSLNALSVESGKAHGGLSNLAVGGIVRVGDSADRSGAQIDRLSGRLGLLAKAGAAFGPAVIPVITAAAPALAGLTTQLGFAAAGAGVAVLAFNGVGDALEAVNAYQLEPTTANLQKMQEAMAGLGPAAREFVGFLDQIGPQLQTIRVAAQEGLLPGVQEGIDSLMSRLPEVRRIVAEIADTTGDLMAGAGAALAGSQWDEFFRFLEAEARPALTTLGQTVGNLAGGIAELWMAMDPLSDDFTSGLLRASEAFERWAAGLAGTEGFEDFLAYVRETGPQVLDTLGALAGMLIDVATAAAPLGGPILAGLEAAAKVISAIAESDLGTPIFTAVAALSALSLATKGLSAVGTSLTGLMTGLRGVDAEGKRATGTVRGLNAAAGSLVGLLFAAEGIQAIQRATDESLPGVESLTGKLMALGDGRISTIGKEFYGFEESLRRITDRTQDESITDALQTPFKGVFGEAGSLRRARAEVESLDAAFANLVATGGVPAAKDAFTDFAQSQGLNAAQQKALLAMMPAYKEALAGAANSADAAADGTDSLTAAQRRASAASQQLKNDLIGLSEALEGRSSMRAYEEAIDAVNKSLKENGRSLDITTARGRANQATLDGIASAALGVAENLRGANKVRFLNRARADFIDAARKMNLTGKQARALAEALGLVERVDPRVTFAERGARDLSKKAGDILLDLFNLDRQNPTPTINVRDLASSTIRSVAAQLFNLDGDVATTTIETIHRNTVINKVENQLGRIPVATGGHIRGPGTATSDSIPALLSDGEYVIKAAAVDKYGTHMFDRLNAMAYANGGPVQRFADGGKVDRLTDRELNRSLREFNVRPDDGWRDARSELRDFARAIRQAGGEVTTRFGRLSTRLVNLSGNYDQVSRALEREKDQRQNLLQARSSLNSTVRGTFNNDIFGNGVAGGFLQLEADRNDARKMLRASRRASDRFGLSGGAERALLESGDLNFAQQLNTRSEVRRFEALFAQRASAQRALGGFAGNEMYGRQINQQNRLINRQTRLMGRLENKIERLESSVERGTYRGSFDANRGRNKDTRARSRRR